MGFREGPSAFDDAVEEAFVAGGRVLPDFGLLDARSVQAGSSEGAHRACILLGIMATCRAQKVPVQAYLTWAFERLGTHRDAFDLPAAELTPAAYRRQLTTT